MYGPVDINTGIYCHVNSSSWDNRYEENIIKVNAVYVAPCQEEGEIICFVWKIQWDEAKIIKWTDVRILFVSWYKRL